MQNVLKYFEYLKKKKKIIILLRFSHDIDDCKIHDTALSTAGHKTLV